MCYYVLQVLFFFFFTSIALWAISGVVAYVGCWLFYRDNFQQWTNQMFSFTVFTFTALVFGDLAKQLVDSFESPRAVPQEAPIEEELGFDGRGVGALNGRGIHRDRY